MHAGSYVKPNHIMTLNVIKPVVAIPPRILTLNVIRPPVSDHSCYILRSLVSNRTYIGYTVNFARRIRQHNGEIKGGAKRTRRFRPWTPVCIIQGFYEASSALRFECRLQHPGRRKRKDEDAVAFTLQTLVKVINSGDGSIEKNNKMPWPPLTVQWFTHEYAIQYPYVNNIYVT